MAFFLEIVVMKKWSFLFYLVLIFQSCSGRYENRKVEATNYQFKIRDSIRVDHQGNLRLFDYDQLNNQFLGMDIRTDEVFIFDGKGKVRSQFYLLKDGPNAISLAQGLGFFKGKFTVMDAIKGLLFFSSEGAIAERIDLSPPFTYINGLNRPVFAFGNELAYIRPERGEMDWNKQSEMFENIYRSPILEVYNPKTNTHRTTMPFPPGTIYADGNFYHWMFPTIIRSGKYWLVFFRAEHAYHVYQKEGEDLVFNKTIDLEIEDAVKIEGVPMASMKDYYEKSVYNIFGRIQNLYVLDSQIVVHYTKGLEKEIVSTFPRNAVEERTALSLQIKNYLAVLDLNHQMVQKDILVPKGIVLSSVSDESGVIVGMKNQDYFGLEEDKVTFYQIELVQK